MIWVLAAALYLAGGFIAAIAIRRWDGPDYDGYGPATDGWTVLVWPPLAAVALIVGIAHLLGLVVRRFSE